MVTENKIDALSPDPAVTIRVTGFQWGWSFQYLNAAKQQIALVETADAKPGVLAGNPTSSQYPQFELPLNETTHIVLVSNDVVHTFYIPAFNFGRYALPGVTNNFDFTPVSLGVFPGQCAQYCGLYHSEMLFSVRVVQPRIFQAWLRAKAAVGSFVMTLLADRPPVFEESPEPEHEHGPSGFLKWITSTDHKVIGKSYPITSFVFFLLAGCMAMLDANPARQPGQHAVVAAHLQRAVHDARQPDDLPVRRARSRSVGSPTTSCRCRSARPTWRSRGSTPCRTGCTSGGGSLMMMGFLTTGSAADFGWVAYAPLSNAVNSPGAGPDLWIVALILTGFLRDLHRGQHRHHDLLPAGPGHDDVPGADLHLEHGRHRAS